MKVKKFFLMMALAACSGLAMAANPIAEFYMGDSYPAWTDAIHWENRINMKTYDFAGAGCTNCSDFTKFEFARDVLYNQGGGVLYYPAGDYYFDDIAAWGNNPDGKGLMLKKGVVILGETPTTSTKAVPWPVFDSNTQAEYQNHGLSDLKTKFHFPYKEIAQSKVVESKDLSGKGLVPYVWNFIGIMKGANEAGLADVSNVGIAWVNLDAAYVFFGFDAHWASTWGTSASSWLVKATKQAGINGWNNRVPDGTNTFDIWCGVSCPADQTGVGKIYTGEKRFVFGCKFDNACVTNYMFDGTWYKNSSNVYQYGMGDNFLSGGSFRYASKIAVYGSNLFIANNVVSEPTKNFIFKSIMYDRETSKITSTEKNLIFNYAYGHCVDVNKQLISQVDNRSDFPDGVQFSKNIVIKDNWLHNAAGKIFDVAGSYTVIQHNVGWKYKCDNSSWNKEYNFTNSFIIPFQNGATISKATDDFMNRFTDLSANNTWVDNNWYTGTGSQANDGEGILIQRTPGEAAAFSLAITNNICGKTGQGKYMGVWDTKAFGYFAAHNLTSSAQEGWVGATNGSVACSAFDNFLNNNTIASPVRNIDGIPNFDLYSPDEELIKAPSNVRASWDPTLKAYTISWKDDSSREMAYVVERKEKTATEWLKIAYRPRQEGITETSYGLGTANGKTFTAVGEFNPANWIDYLASSTKEYEYRVGTVYTLSTGTNTELIKYSAAIVEGTAVISVKKDLSISILPNPVTDFLIIKSTAKEPFNYEVITVNGAVVKSGNASSSVNLSISDLSNGLYMVKVINGSKVTTKKIIKK
ncbi:MAG: T9SS type A sorting domain-containing protein [Paludibacter sp.]|nr:T9SS type A sorting domain-containing protein [Paludibacter sp.]